MIQNLSKYLLLTTFAILTLGCEKENSVTFEDLIIGRWDWVESVSPWTGLVKNPQTEGYSQTLEFTEKGFMKQYQNDTLLNSTNYRLEIYSTNPDKYEIIYSSEMSAHISYANDSLFFNSAYVDGPVTTYVRIE